MGIDEAAEASSDEEIIAIGSHFNLDGLSRTKGELIFTNKRLLWVKTMGKADIFALSGFTSFISNVSAMGKSDALKAMPLPKILNSNYEVESFVYSEMEMMKLKKPFFGNASIICKMKGSKKKKFWAHPREIVPVLDAVEQLKSHHVPLL